MSTRVGIGFDAHPLTEGRQLVLAGVTIRWPKGLAGQSDGDVLTHAAIDAILGGSGQGDIGTHFPSNDRQYKNASGATLMAKTIRIVGQSGWRTQYLDATIIAETPVLTPYVESIRAGLAGSMGVDTNQVSIKATSTNTLGFIGRSDGIAAIAVATLESLE
ncbi:MAG: 2-C-methyl-D-erythritol 2,4-cyclodiphosphate synthase [SAR202 cluster bacterium]|nr:2-C-methyl-D-erythritol 2,4-cyclodiphosphate synthase [SAR202 cluster bacterium]